MKIKYFHKIYKTYYTKFDIYNIADWLFKSLFIHSFRDL